MELPEIISITRALRQGATSRGPGAYHETLARMGADELRALGEQYLERTRIHRKLGKPFFIDKMPNNFAHIGLIHLVLPNAKIIDARRHPLALLLVRIQAALRARPELQLSLEDLGRYYRDYVELMAHFDAVLPGRVHRVIYEDAGRRHRARSAPPARLLRPAVRRRVPAFLRQRAAGAHGELRAGAPADLSRAASISGGISSRGSIR